MKKNEVGKDQLNTEKANYNERVDNLSILGSTKRNQWDKKRRFKSI